MYKRYLLARQIFQIRKMQETTYSALKKSEDLHRHLLNMTVEWDEAKCDEMVELYIFEANASTIPIVAVVAPALVSVVAPLVSEPSSAADTAPRQPSSSDLSLLSAESLERLRFEGEAEPPDRLAVWNGWVQQYISKKEEYAHAWCRSQALEGLVGKCLIYPLTAEEEPVLETIFSFFLVKGVDIRKLIDLLKAASATEPDREARENIVSLFSSLRASPTQLFSPSSLPSSVVGPLNEPINDESALAHLDSSCKLLVARDKGPAAAFGQLEAVCRSRNILTQLREGIQAPLAGQKRELQDLLVQRDAGKQERNQALLAADKTIGETQLKLKAVQEREAALRAQLDACIAERLQLEQEFFKARGVLDLTCRQQNQRILILTANIEHQEHEVQSRARMLSALDSLMDNITSAQPTWTALASRWTQPLDERLSLVEQYFARLEERLEQLKVKLRGNAGTPEAPMQVTVEKLQNLFDRAKNGPYALLLTQVEALPLVHVVLLQAKLDRIASVAQRIESTLQTIA